MKDEQYYNSLDKRTREYKQWKAKFQENEPKGLGNVIEVITKATGIKKGVEFLYGEDCGCEERKENLNRLFKRDHPKCLNQDEYEDLKEYFDTFRANGREVTVEQQEMLVRINNRVFRTQEQVSSCADCVRTLHNRMKRLYENYK